MDIKYSNVTVELIGHDGNAFAIIGQVNRELTKAYGAAVAKEFVDAAMSCESYDALLALVQNTVHVV